MTRAAARRCASKKIPRKHCALRQHAEDLSVKPPGGTLPKFRRIHLVATGQCKAERTTSTNHKGSLTSAFTIRRPDTYHAATDLARDEGAERSASLADIKPSPFASSC